MTQSPWRAAASSSDTGGIVCGILTVLNPAAAICAKSRSIVSWNQYSSPRASGAKAP